MGFRWTDTHGIGACTICGAPYRLYHYDGEGADAKPVDKPPQLLIKPDFVALTKEYWGEHKRNVAPGAFNMPGSSYEVATSEDFRASSEWWKTHSPITKGDNR